MRTAPPPARSFPKALACAIRGLHHAAKTQRHFRAQLVIGAVALFAAALAGLGALEVAVLAVTTAIVLGAELLNTAIETLTDLVHPDLAPAAAVVKDVSAAAAMTAAGLALTVGVLVFLPRLSALSVLAARGIPLVLSLLCVIVLSAGLLWRR